MPEKTNLSKKLVRLPSFLGLTYSIFRVPYHCPEQKSLKEFLESLKITKSKLVTEEKVEVKTTKYKLLKDLPRKDIASLETQALDSELERESDTIPKRDLQSYGSGKCKIVDI